MRPQTSSPASYPTHACGSAPSLGSDLVGDYIEKAETKALGRALAALGFGTQFCPDFEFGAREGRVVDAPVALEATRGRMHTRASERGGPTIPSVNGATAQRSASAGTMSGKQAAFLASIARTLRLSEEELGKEAQAFCGKPVDELGRREACRFIDHLRARRAAV